MMMATYRGKTGKVIVDNVGRVRVDFGDEQRWVLKGIPDLELFEHKSRGRPAKHENNAEKQRAYRQRKAVKALRKSEQGGQS